MSNVKDVSVVETMQMINEKYGAGLILPLGDVFTPERLLGVLTDLGYVEEVGETYLNTEKYLWCGFDSVKYYISDDSDETVSLDEYIKLFYNTEDAL